MHNRFLYVLVGYCSVQAAVGCHRLPWLFQSVNQPAELPIPSLAVPAALRPTQSLRGNAQCHHPVPGLGLVNGLLSSSCCTAPWALPSPSDAAWDLLSIVLPELAVSSSAAPVDPSSFTWTTQAKSSANPPLPLFNHTTFLASFTLSFWHGISECVLLTKFGIPHGSHIAATNYTAQVLFCSQLTHIYKQSDMQKWNTMTVTTKAIVQYQTTVTKVSNTENFIS